MISPQLYHEDKIPSPWIQIWRNFAKRPSAIMGFWCLIVIILLSIIGPWIAPYSPEYQTGTLLLPPSWSSHGSIQFVLGTDDLGRDLFSRLLHGARLTFGYAVIAVIVSLCLGIIIGLLSGISDGIKSSILGHLMDSLLALPTLLLALLFAAVLGPGLNNVIWAVGLALLPGFIRVVNNAVADEIRKEYVLAARLDGANGFQLLRYVILPNITNPIIIQATLAFSIAILDVAALGFLNLGAQSPSPEWGAMAHQGAANILTSPWTITLPGLAIVASVLATNLVGDGLRRAIEEERG